MRGLLGFLSMMLVLAAAGCGSDDTGVSGDLLVDIDNLRVELPCLGSGSAPVNCRTPDADEASTTIDGEAGVAYYVTIRLRGVVEQKTYTDYTNPDGMWVEGGSPDGGSYNVFRLHVSSPEKTWYLNAGSSGIDECYPLDIQKTIAADNGAVLTLLADAGGDALSTRNIDGNGDPIIISGVSPYPYAFDGQFVQIDVADVRIR